MAKNYKARNIVALEHPILIKEWYKASNKRDTPYNVTAGSDKIVTWRCIECDHLWDTKVNDRAIRKTGCPKCMESYNVAFPEMAIFYYLKKAFKDVELNFEIENIEPYKSVDVYLPSLNLIIEYDGGLTHANKFNKDLEKSKLILEQGYVLFRIRDNGLLPLNIEGIEEYLYRRESNKSLQNMLNHLLDMLINRFKEQSSVIEKIRTEIDINRDNMSILATLPPVVKKINSLGCYPFMKEIWDYGKNDPMKPEHFSPYSNHIASFNCDKGHSYLAQIGSKTKGHSCKVCDGQVATKENNLALSFPNLALEWNYEKNQKNPDEYLPYSNKTVHWNCQICKSTYGKMINERTGGGENCPYCAGKRVNATNCLSTTHPDLIKEWDYEKNLNVKPDEITRGSKKKVYWLCKEGHSYEATISRRAGKNGTGCRECYELYGRKALKKTQKENSLAAKAPEIAKQWDTEKNKITPDKIARFSKKVFWWKCDKRHEFERSPNSRRSEKCEYC